MLLAGLSWSSRSATEPSTRESGLATLALRLAPFGYGEPSHGRFLSCLEGGVTGSPLDSLQSPMDFGGTASFFDLHGPEMLDVVVASSPGSMF